MIQPFAPFSFSWRRIALAVLAALTGHVALTAPSAAAAADRASADRAAYVLIAEGGQSTSMRGSTDDLSRARSLRRGREGLLYFRQAGTAYVVRDADMLRRAVAIFAPQQALGARQAELGSRQAALGSRQAALGQQQARLGLQQAAASPGRADELARQQDALARQQDELGRQQNALGRLQDTLGREQDRLAGEVDAGIRALLAEAIRRGVAQRVD